MSSSGGYDDLDIIEEVEHPEEESPYFNILIYAPIVALIDVLAISTDNSLLDFSAVGTTFLLINYYLLLEFSKSREMDSEDK